MIYFTSNRLNLLRRCCSVQGTLIALVTVCSIFHFTPLLADDNGRVSEAIVPDWIKHRHDLQGVFGEALMMAERPNRFEIAANTFRILVVSNRMLDVNSNGFCTDDFRKTAQSMAAVSMAYDAERWLQMDENLDLRVSKAEAKLYFRERYRSSRGTSSRYLNKLKGKYIWTQAGESAYVNSQVYALFGNNFKKSGRDLNQDGVIEMTDRANYYRTLYKGFPTDRLDFISTTYLEKLQKMFLWDKNNDGCVTMSELKSAMSQLDHFVATVQFKERLRGGKDNE